MTLHKQSAYYFDLTEDEEVLIFLRRHPITNWRWILGGAILVLVPILMIAPMEIINISVITDLVVLLSIVWYAIITGFVLESFVMWYFNVYIVTNKRLVDIDVYGFLSKTVAEAPLSNVQDVTLRAKGLGPTLFNLGDILIQTAGTERVFVFDRIHRPTEIHDLITDLLKTYSHWEPGSHARTDNQIS